MLWWFELRNVRPIVGPSQRHWSNRIIRTIGSAYFQHGQEKTKWSWTCVVKFEIKKLFRKNHRIPWKVWEAEADNQTDKPDFKKWGKCVCSSTKSYMSRQKNPPNRNREGEMYCTRGNTDSLQPNAELTVEVSARCLIGDRRPPWGQGPKQTSRAHFHSQLGVWL